MIYLRVIHISYLFQRNVNTGLVAAECDSSIMEIWVQMDPRMDRHTQDHLLDSPLVYKTSGE